MSIINVCAPGHLDPYDSFGLIACQLARHLSALGAHVNLWSLGDRKPPSLPADILPIVDQPMRMIFGGLLLGHPTGYSYYPDIAAQMGRRIAITMFESSRLPAGWVEILNELDAVIVPSTFCVDVFRNAGVTVPIHLAPLGVGEAYKPAGRAPGRPFTFLAFLDRGLRKGGVAALQAFLQAFGDDPAYRMILKQREVVLRAEILNPNVEVVYQDMTERELYNLYLRCDCLVNPNKGEGFGLIPREFAATGGIAMATNWGGTADGIGVWGVPIPYKLVPADWSKAQRLAGQDLGEWAEVDIDELAALMRQVSDQRVAYSWIAANVAPQVRKLYDWRAFAAKVLDVWRGEQ